MKIRKTNDKDWTEVPLTHGYTGEMRGIGVADMACAIAADRPHRASGELAFHVLDPMQAFVEANERGHHIFLGTTCRRPALPVGLPPGNLD